MKAVLSGDIVEVTLTEDEFKAIANEIYVDDEQKEYLIGEVSQKMWIQIAKAICEERKKK